MDKPLISIIVPMFNAEKYIAVCIESVLKQTYKNVELILINDGSTDWTEKICKEFEQDNTKIRYFYQENGGVSSARNKGLFKAKGRYVLFVDSDDYVEKTYVENLYQSMENADLSVCGYKIYEKATKTYTKVNTSYSTGSYSDQEFFKWLFTFEDVMYQGYLWNKMFRRDIIEENEIRFDEDIKYNEDRLFVLKYLKKVDTVYFCDNPLYVYVQNDESAMGKIKHKFFKGMITELEAFDRMLKVVDEECELQKILLVAYIAGCRMMRIADKEAKKIICSYCTAWRKQMSHLSVKDICRVIYNIFRMIF